MRTMLKMLSIALIFIAATSAQAQTYHHYECTDGASFEVAFYPQTKAAYLQFDGKSLQLPKRFSLTSQRFAQNGVTFSMKSGGIATIRRAGKTSQCKVN
jgi:hypothetical protein